MRNLITRAVFDKTFKAGEKFGEADLSNHMASFQYSDGDGYHFMDQESFETMTLGADVLGDDAQLLTDNLIVQIQKFEGNPIAMQLPPLVELVVKETPEANKGNTASGGATKMAVLETGLQIRVPQFIKEGERVKVHTETREFSGRA
jgi:elongation factor P